MDIDAIIAEATQPVAQTQTATPTEEVAPSDNQEVNEESTAESLEDLSKKSDNELTPEQLAKRQANRKSHENSKLAQMRREAREAKAETQRLQAEINAIRQGNQPKPEQNLESQEPKAENFETWEDYNKALIRYEAKQIREAENKQNQEIQHNQEHIKWIDERSSRVDTRITELAQTIPDFENTLEDVEDLLGDTFGVDTRGNVNLPPQIARLALEADDVNLAAYTLHKEGKLLEVMKMPPMRAAMEIAKAEIRGAAYLKQLKPVTNAPAPLSPAKGNKVGSAPLQNQSVDEIMKWLKH